MRAAWATDVHLEFIPFPRPFYLDLRETGAEAILLTGDIATAPTVEGMLRDMADVVDVPIWFVLGNHDFYLGSIEDVRAWARRETESASPLGWLPAAGVVSLTERTALVGVDGFGDGRLGDPLTSRVLLSDWEVIRELTPPGGLTSKSRTEWVLPRLRERGDREAAALEGPLLDALGGHEEVYVLTHVPPFAEATWHQGSQSDPDWLPWFSCEAVGKTLLAAAEEHPDRRITVLCGHTHGNGEARIRENLLVLTGGAKYGRPEVARVLEIS
jgi:hypothetical protein